MQYNTKTTEKTPLCFSNSVEIDLNPRKRSEFPPTGITSRHLHFPSQHAEAAFYSFHKGSPWKFTQFCWIIRFLVLSRWVWNWGKAGGLEKQTAWKLIISRNLFCIQNFSSHSDLVVWNVRSKNSGKLNQVPYHTFLCQHCQRHTGPMVLIL